MFDIPLARALMPAVLAMLAMFATVSTSDPAAAQSCVSDSQCGSGIGTNTCLGDTLVMRRRSCQGGNCVEQEMGRRSCGSGSRCDALSGTCVSSGITTTPGRGATTPGGGIRSSGCIPSCTCRGNTLIIGTGTRGPGGRCFQSVQQCRSGCSCSPEPRCGEDARPRPRASAVPPGGARVPLPTADPVQVAPRRIAGQRRIVKKKKRARRPASSR